MQALHKFPDVDGEPLGFRNANVSQVRLCPFDQLNVFLSAFPYICHQLIRQVGWSYLEGISNIEKNVGQVISTFAEKLEKLKPT